jgi:hypothetical protein
MSLSPGNGAPLGMQLAASICSQQAKIRRHSIKASQCRKATSNCQKLRLAEPLRRVREVAANTLDSKDKLNRDLPPLLSQWPWLQAMAVLQHVDGEEEHIDSRKLRCNMSTERTVRRSCSTSVAAVVAVVEANAHRHHQVEFDGVAAGDAELAEVAVRCPGH